MKGLSIFVLAGVVVAGAGALAYKLYKDKKAEQKASAPEEIEVTFEEAEPDDIPEDVFEDDTAEDLPAEESAEKPDEE